MKIVKTIPLFVGTYRTTSSTSYTSLVYRIPIDLNLSYYDGTVEVYFEVVGEVTNAGVTGYAELWDDTASTQLAELTWVGETSPTRKRSANIAGSIINGNTLIVRHKISNASYSHRLRHASLIIKQSGTITKTETWIPLSASYSQFNSTSYGTFYYRTIWDYNTAYWDGIDTVVFRSVFRTTNAATTAYACVYTVGGSAISASELSTASTSYYVNRTSGDIKASLVNGTSYTLRMKNSNADYNIEMFSSFLRIRQSNFTKTECHLCIDLSPFDTVDTNYVDTYSSFLWDSNDWVVNAKTIYFTSTMRTSDASGTTSVQLRHGATVDVTLTTSSTSTYNIEDTFTPVDDQEYDAFYKTNNAFYTAYSYGLAIIVRITEMGSSSSSSSSKSSSSSSSSRSSSSSSSSAKASSSSSSKSSSSSSSSSRSSSSSSSSSRSSSSSSSSRSSSSSSSRSSSSSSSMSSSSSSMTPGWTWGEAAPIGHTAEEWPLWTFKESEVTARNTGDYGKVQLYTGEEFVSPVKDTGSTNVKFLTITFDEYASGSGSFSIEWRGSANIFTQDADEVTGPAWEEYIIGANKSWRYVQVKITGL